MMLKTLILTMSLMASTAFAGGAGDGGGDILPDNPTNPLEVRQWLDEAKVPVRLALNHLEYVLSGVIKAKNIPAETVHIYRKLFASKKTIFQSLDEAVWVPLEKGGCEDLGGVEHDASALKNAPNICFAMENLSQKLGSKSGRSKIVALIVHEVSHLSGTTETEAKIIQEMVQNDVSDSIFSIGDSMNEVKENTNSIVENLEDLYRSVSSKKIDFQFCTVLAVGLTEMNTLQQRNFDYGSSVGIGFFRSNNMWRLSAALLRSINLLSVCAGNHIDLKRVARAFDGKKEIPLSRFYGAVYESSSTVEQGDQYTSLSFSDFIEDRPIRRVTSKSKTAILAEIQEIVALMKPLQVELR